MAKTTTKKAAKPAEPEAPEPVAVPVEPDQAPAEPVEAPIEAPAEAETKVDVQTFENAPAEAPARQRRVAPLKYSNKRCTGCKRILPVGSFPADPKGRFGVSDVCNSCTRLEAKRAKVAAAKQVGLKAERAALAEG